MIYSERALAYFEKCLQYANDSYNTVRPAGSRLLIGQAGIAKNQDMVMIFLTVNPQQIIEVAKCKVYGSVATLALSAYLCEWLQHKPLSSMQALTVDCLLRALDLPNTKAYAARLLLQALDSVENK